MWATTSRSEAEDDAVSDLVRVDSARTKLDNTASGWQRNWSSVPRQELIRWGKVPPIDASLLPRRSWKAMPTSPTAPHCIARPIRQHFKSVSVIFSSQCVQKSYIVQIFLLRQKYVHTEYTWANAKLQLLRNKFDTAYLPLPVKLYCYVLL